MRLAIYRELIKAANQGVPVGEVQEALGIPHSTLSHHLHRLMQVGLITQRREGRTLFCSAECDALTEVIQFLTEECCINSSCCQ